MSVRSFNIVHCVFSLNHQELRTSSLCPLPIPQQSFFLVQMKMAVLHQQNRCFTLLVDFQKLLSYKQNRDIDFTLSNVSIHSFIHSWFLRDVRVQRSSAATNSGDSGSVEARCLQHAIPQMYCLHQLNALGDCL